MLSKTALALAAASLALDFAALTPAMANYDRCYENPGCPGNYDLKQSNMPAPRNRGAEHRTTTRHHG
jgi:hypothetical protein